MNAPVLKTGRGLLGPSWVRIPPPPLPPGHLPRSCGACSSRQSPGATRPKGGRISGRARFSSHGDDVRSTRAHRGNSEQHRVPPRSSGDASMKRNSARFPEDFMFQLTKEEATVLRSQSATSKTGRGGRRSPHMRSPSREWRCCRASCAANAPSPSTAIFESLRQLAAPPAKPKRKVGFAPPQDGRES